MSRVRMQKIEANAPRRMGGKKTSVRASPLPWLSHYLQRTFRRAPPRTQPIKEDEK